MGPNPRSGLEAERRWVEMPTIVVENRVKPRIESGVERRVVGEMVDKLPSDVATLDHSGSSHKLVLGQSAVRVRVHAVAARLDVLDKAETKGPPSVLVALELCDGGLGRVGIVEADHSATTRSTAGLVLDLGLLDLADGGEQLDEVFIAGGPRELRSCQSLKSTLRSTGGCCIRASLTLRT